MQTGEEPVKVALRLADATVRALTAYAARKERNYFLFADHRDRILVPDAPRDTTA